MAYIVWLDVLFVNNLVMDFFLLRLVKKLCGGKAGVWASLAAAAFGAAGYCLLLVVPFGLLWKNILTHVVVNTVMVSFGCGLRTGKKIGKGIAGLYIAGFLLGGMMEFVKRLFGGSGLSGILLTATCCYLVYTVVLPLYLVRREKTKIYYRVVLKLGERKTELMALFDTGNRLYDPIFCSPVNIIRQETLEKLFDMVTVKELREFQQGKTGREQGNTFRKMQPHFLTFSSLGCTTGLLVAVTLDTMYLESENSQKVIHHPVVAFSGEDNSYFGNCQMILHPNLIDS